MEPIPSSAAEFRARIGADLAAAWVLSVRHFDHETGMCLHCQYSVLDSPHPKGSSPMIQPMHSDRRRGRATGRKDDMIQIRASAETKALLGRAATLRGQKLSEFMLESARRRAEETVLDQRAFFLNAEDHEKFVAMLENPTMPSKALRALMKRKPAWER